VGVASNLDMKILGFLLLLAGWIIVLAAIEMLSALEARGAFVAAGIAIEAIGLVLVIRSHSAPQGLED
jgi:glutamate synthase domain-containing protein 1